MAESFSVRFSSSVDPSKERSRAINDEEYMKKHGQPPYPKEWRRVYNQKKHTVESCRGALKHFYTMLNGMEILFGEVCKCVIYTKIPPDLRVFDMEDGIFDVKALRKGETRGFIAEQEEGLSGNDKDTISGLLLHTMSECYFKKKSTIDKVYEIETVQKRFSEFSSEEITEIETSPEKRNDELSPGFDSCLKQMNEDELHEGFKKLYIETWKHHADFYEKESKVVQRMDEVTRNYFETIKATEDKNLGLSNEVRKLKAKCTTLETKNSELKEKHKKELESHKKQNEQLQKNFKECKSKMDSFNQDIILLQKKNYEIQKDRADMDIKVSKLQEELQLRDKNASDLQLQHTSQVQDMVSEISRYENLVRQLQDDKTKLQREIEKLTAKKEDLLTRLSKVAGAKLTHENTEVTDLSDPNRPTKLGDKFKEIYDNEWTEALEELTGNVGVPDRAAVDFLLDVMMKSFRFCSETLEKQAENCFRCFEELPIPDSEDLKADDCFTHSRVVIEDHLKVEIDRIRRNVVGKMRSIAKERYLASIEVYLKKKLNQDSDMTSKSCENSMHVLKRANDDAFTDTNSPNPEEEVATNNLQKLVHSEEFWQPEKGLQSTEPMDDDQESTSLQSSPSKSFQCTKTNLNTSTASDVNLQVSVENDVAKLNNSKNEKEHKVNVSQAGENQQESSNEMRTDSNPGSQGNVQSNQLQFAGNVQTGSSENKQDGIIQMGDENKQDGIIQMGDETAPQGRKTGGQNMKESFPKIYRYSWKCFSLCWLMRNHSPRLHLDDQVEKGSEFDLNRFRHYTQTGKNVDFLVWPALYLQKGGPLIAKGVAQPVK